MFRQSQLENKMSNALGVVWTPAMVDRFKELVADKDLAYRDIAAQMSHEFGVNLTKNACIGKGRRLGVEARQPGLGNRRPAKKTKNKYVRIQVDAPIAPVMAPRVRDPALGITIYELREGDCKWPLGKTGDYPPFMYCGGPALFGQPWCKKHCELAYTPAHLRRQEVV
jgi:hypothetical protein